LLYICLLLDDLAGNGGGKDAIDRGLGIELVPDDRDETSFFIS